MLAEGKMKAQDVLALAHAEIERIRQVRIDEDIETIREARKDMPRKYAKILWLIPIAVLTVEYTDDEVIAWLKKKEDKLHWATKLYRPRGWRSNYMYNRNGIAELKQIVRLCTLVIEDNQMAAITLSEGGAQLITGPLTKEG